jgi:GAF domain-containing protein
VPTVTSAFAAATAALVDDYDVVGVVSRLLRDCSALLSQAAVGVVVVGHAGQLELLASTSHAADQIELFQLQSEDGPCVECLRTGELVVETTVDSIATRWPLLAAPFRSQGWQSVHAVPMRWHGRLIGSLNAFDSSPVAMGVEQIELAQAFADVTTMAIVHADQDVTGRVMRQTRQALRGRTLIEQAKGVLAYQLEIDMASAYTALMRLADERGQSLSVVAADVVASAVPR